MVTVSKGRNNLILERAVNLGLVMYAMNVFLYFGSICQAFLALFMLFSSMVMPISESSHQLPRLDLALVSPDMLTGR